MDDDDDLRNSDNDPMEEDEEEDDDASTTTNEDSGMEMGAFLDTTVDGSSGKARDILQAREVVRQLEKKHLERTLKACFMVDAKRAWKNCTSAQKNLDTVTFLFDVCNPKTNPLPHDLTWAGCEKLPSKISNDRDLLLQRLEVVPDFEETFYDTPFLPPKNLCSDQEIMLAICSRHSQALKYCSKHLQNDPQVVRAAITQRFHFAPMAIQFASSKLRNQKSIAKVVLSREYGIRAFCHLGDRLQQDHRLAMLAIKKAGKEYAATNEHFLDLPFEFRNDDEVVWEAVKQRGSNLRFVTDPDLLKDYDLVIEACRQNGTALAFAHESMQRKILSNPEDLMLVLSNGGGAWLDEAEPPVPSGNGAHYWEPPYMLTAMQNGHDGERFNLLEIYHTDPDFFFQLLSVSNNIYEVYKLLPEELQGTKEVILAIFDTNEYIDEELVCAFFGAYDFFAEDKTFLLQVMRKGFVSFLSIDSAKSTMDDKSFVVQACKIDGSCLEYASDRLKMDEDCLRSALAESEEPIEFFTISNKFPGDIWNRSNLVSLIIRHVNNKNCYGDGDGDGVGNLDPDDELSTLGQAIYAKVPLVLWRGARTVFLTYAQRGFPMELIDREARRSYAGDTEIQLAILATKPTQRYYRHYYYSYNGQLSWNLLSSLSFMQQAVMIDPRILASASKHLLPNFELMLSAVGNSPVALTGFKHSASKANFKLLVRFTERVRARKEQIDGFVVEFLRGIMMNRLSPAASEPPKKKPRRGQSKAATNNNNNNNNKGDHSNVCHLPLLDCGLETGLALKRLIADFAGVPLGPSYKLLRNADDTMKMFGY